MTHFSDLLVHPSACKATVIGAVASLCMVANAAAAELPRENIVLKTAISVDPVANTVVLPLHKGKANGQTVWYIVTDSSDRDDALARGVLYAPLSAKVGVTENVVQKGGALQFAGVPNFAPKRLFTPSESGFPPIAAKPGAEGESAYSPFIRINGSSTVLNAPIVATGDGPFDVVAHTNTEDRVLSIDPNKKTVMMLLAHGFSGGHEVLYISTEASDPGVAAIERATYVPSLAQAAAKVPIIVFENGQTGTDNPQAQGLKHAALDTNLTQDATLDNAPTLMASRNILTAIPSGAAAAAYSPVWDVQIAAWTPQEVATRKNVLQKDQANVFSLIGEKAITGPEGKPFGSVGTVVNCPVVALLDAAP